MQLNKPILYTLLATTLFGTTLSAIDIQGVSELKYSAADAKATSYFDTANDITYAPNLSIGAYLPEYNARAMLNYKPIRWKDAKADLVSLSLEYVFQASKKIDIYAGAGLGSMSYEVVGLKDTKTVYTLQTGLNYNVTESFYAVAGINYLNTNNLGVEKNKYIYSDVQNMLSAEIGIGFRFGYSPKTAPLQQRAAQADTIEQAESHVETIEQNKIEERAEQIVQEAIKAPKKAKVQASSLRVRATPDLNNPPMKSLQNNEIIEIDSCMDGWCKLANQEGFVSEEFILIEQ